MSPSDLKTFRARLGWSEQRLAERLGVDRNTVIRWELGLHPISPMAGKLLRTLRPAPASQTSGTTLLPQPRNR